jgi:hypothetical protein
LLYKKVIAISDAKENLMYNALSTYCQIGRLYEKMNLYDDSERWLKKCILLKEQIEAIISGKERITANLINDMSKKNMPLTLPMITALRNNCIDDLDKYDDIKSINIGSLVEDFDKNRYYKKQLDDVLDSNIYKNNLKKNEIIGGVSMSLVQLGFTNSNAVNLVEKVITENGLNNNLDFYLQEIGKIIRNTKSVQNDKSVEKQKKNKATKGKAKTRKEIYENYIDSGIIKSLEADFGIKGE